jgi:hypothetical protein
MQSSGTVPRVMCVAGDHYCCCRGGFRHFPAHSLHGVETASRTRCACHHPQPSQATNTPWQTPVTPGTLIQRPRHVCCPTAPLRHPRVTHPRHGCRSFRKSASQACRAGHSPKQPEVCQGAGQPAAPYVRGLQEGGQWGPIVGCYSDALPRGISCDGSPYEGRRQPGTGTPVDMAGGMIFRSRHREVDCRSSTGCFPHLGCSIDFLLSSRSYTGLLRVAFDGTESIPAGDHLQG